jgi:hypothetical protein
VFGHGALHWEPFLHVRYSPWRTLQDLAEHTRRVLGYSRKYGCNRAGILKLVEGQHYSKLFRSVDARHDLITQSKYAFRSHVLPSTSDPILNYHWFRFLTLTHDRPACMKVLPLTVPAVDMQREAVSSSQCCFLVDAVLTRISRSLLRLMWVQFSETFRRSARLRRWSNLPPVSLTFAVVCKRPVLGCVQVLQRRMAERLVNWKRFGRKRPSINWEFVW